MIALFTDFGSADLYVGQVKAVLFRGAPGVPVVDLLHEVPDFNVRAGAHLLSALAAHMPPGSLVLSVVDPGVGSARGAAVIEADGRWYVGPDNGLLSVVAGRAAQCRTWRIRWRPEGLSASFHGRDLFAPIAAELATGGFPEDKLDQADGLGVDFGTDDLAEIIYIDHYGNGITGIRAARAHRGAKLAIGDTELPFARVYSEVPPGAAFWYENSLGLVEIAVNQGHAARVLGLAVGQALRLE
jgi:S-adenosylmethionine hydrolase